ncbi:histone H1-like [Rosa chinensis]|uniref:histone H1-like n=1 Tax=Rosa chinensis TaxID=74649 RepID=UPI000D089A96|nr:histone H1-like [Rosa chinensis]
MAIYNNTVKPINGMDLWSTSGEPSILPPQYSRQPRRPRTKRMKDVSEKAEVGGIKLDKSNTQRKRPATKNELRHKVKIRAEKLKAAAVKGSNALSKPKGRPPKPSATSAPATTNAKAPPATTRCKPPAKPSSSSKQAAPSRSSSIIRDNANDGKK